MGKRYSLNELKYLEDNWRTQSHRDLGNHLKRSEASVRNRLWLLRLVSCPQWSEEEVDALKILYDNQNGQIELGAFAQSIGRLKPNVSRKARELGLVTNRHRRLPFEERSPKYQFLMKRREESAEEKHQRRSTTQRESVKKYGHPRGYRELRICPVCGRFFDVEHSNKKKYCSPRCSYMRPRTVNLYTRSKSGKREDLGDTYFRSRYEANYARYLNFLMANGEPIEKWEFEPDTFEFKKIKRGVRFYTPDFKVTFKDGHIEYHEVKGWDYPKGKTARKRMAKYYSYLKLVLVDEEFFKAVRAQGFHRLIPGWE